MDLRSHRSGLAHAVGVAACLAASLGGCNALSGAGDLRVEPSAADSGGATRDGQAPDAAPYKLPTDDEGGTSGVPCAHRGNLEAQTLSPTVAVDDPRIGTVAWSNVDGAKVSGGPSTRATLDGNQFTHWLLTTTYGFTLPAGASVRGFVVTVTRSAGFADEIGDHAIALVKAGELGQTKQNNKAWGTGTESVMYGGESDTWGTKWTSEEVNAGTFGAAVSARGIDALSEDAMVDHIEITAYFERCGF